MSTPPFDLLSNLNLDIVNSLNQMEFKGDAYTERVDCGYTSSSNINWHSNSHMTILHCNIRSMRSNFDKFSAEFLSSEYCPDVIGCCETHLTDTTQNLYKLQSFNLYATNVSNNKGGVCLYISNKFASKIRNDLCMQNDHIESVFVECRVNGKSIIIGVIYHRPGTSLISFQNDLVDTIERANSECILMGDFNINILNRDDNHISNFVNILKEMYFYPIITKPTRVFNSSATLLDHIWINFRQENKPISKIIVSSITDHYPVLFYCELTDKCDVMKRITFRKKGEEQDRLFKQMLESSNIYDILLIQDVDLAYQHFHNLVSKIYDESYPLIVKNVKLNSFKNPWITPGIITSIETKNKLHKKYVKMPITYGNIFRKYRNALTKTIKNAKNAYYHQKFSNCNGNIKQTWSEINKILGKQSNMNATFKINNKYTSNVDIIANAFNEQFTTLARKTTNSIPYSNNTYNDYLPPINCNEIVWAPTTATEVKNTIVKCNITKPGPDEIPIIVYKNNVDFFVPIITHLCNLSMTSGIFPTMHKKANVIPLFKKLDRDDISNYRPISLLNSISKILEKIVSTRLINHFETNNLFSDSQYAYRKGRGTDLAVTKLSSDILRKFDNGEITAAVYLDLTSAFDCVNHKILVHKLRHYGVNRNALKWLSDYLSNRIQYVTFGGAKSSEVVLNTGVPQGSILGPILFLIYFNDFCNSVHSGTQVLYADDANHYVSGRDVFYVIKRINDDIKLIIKWLRANRLSFNIIKTEAMIFSRKNIYFPLPPILIDNTAIPYSYIVKFLGILIDFKLTWKEHIRKVQSKISSACGILYTIRSKISIPIAKLIYQSIALPYLNYCNIVWSSASASCFQSITTTQKKLIRIIMVKKRFEHTTPLFSCLKLLKFADICYVNSAMFVFKSYNNFISSPIQFESRIQGPYNIRNREPLTVPFVRSKQSQRFIHVRCSELWNNLPVYIRTVRTIITFKRKIKERIYNAYLNDP